MKTQQILWAVKIGDPDYAEQILTDKPERFEAAKQWAKANGFDRFRISEIDLDTKPDFTKTLNK